jgi:hypothetical protein
VTIRATVCFVPLHIGNVDSTARAAAGSRIEDQRRERFIGGSVVAREVYPENRSGGKKALRPGGTKRLEEVPAPRTAPKGAC